MLHLRLRGDTTIAVRISQQRPQRHAGKGAWH
jgi:hypothetical protein